MASSDDRIIERWVRWVFDTCMMFGCRAETAAAVAGHFGAGIRGEWAKEAVSDGE